MSKAVPATITNLPTVPAVFEREGVAFATTRAVAEFVGKRHSNVLRDVDALLRHAADLRHASDLRGAWFREVHAPHPTVSGRTDRAFELTRDGAVLLISGYTGPKAVDFKVAYIRRFNEMEAALRTKAVTVRRHRRARPRIAEQPKVEAPVETPRLALLRELEEIVAAACERLRRGGPRNFGEALERVLLDVQMAECSPIYAPPGVMPGWSQREHDARQAKVRLVGCG